MTNVSYDMKHLHPYLYKIIHDKVQSRIRNRVSPYVAIANEVKAAVMEDVSVALEEMEADGLITRSENVNGIALYRPLKQEQDENDYVQ